MDIAYAINRDPQAALDVFMQSADLWLSKALVKDLTAVLDISVPSEATLIPATAPGWVSGAYDGKTLVIAGQEVVIVASTDTEIQFDASALTGLVNGATYAFRVHGAEEWIGYSEGKSFKPEDKFAKFYDGGVPASLVRQDLISREITAKGKLKTQKFLVLAAMLGLKVTEIAAAPEADPPTPGYIVGDAGSNPSSFNDRFAVFFKTSSVNNKARQLKGYYGDIKLDGDMALDEGEYKMIGFTITFFADPIRRVAGTSVQDTDYYQLKDEV